MIYLDGDLPPILYRYFDTEVFADALVSGDIWISTLEACRNYEERGRRDSGEGELTYNSGFIQGDGTDPAVVEVGRRSGISIGPGVRDITMDNNTHFQRLPDAWVLCMTEFRRPDGIDGIGRYCVEIREPRAFFEHVSAELHRTRGIREGAMGRIRYLPRAYRSLEPIPGPVGFVKPPDEYAEQREVRMLWIPANRSQPLSASAIRCAAASRLCARVR